jgi:hypothetical protein
MNPGHNWSGFPGGYCLKCGAECAIESAIGEGWYDPFDDRWDTEEHRLEVLTCDGCCAADYPMKVQFSIAALEKAISAAQYQDPAYEPGRTTSKIKTVVLDVPDPLRAMLLAQINDLRGIPGIHYLPITVNGAECDISVVNFEDLNYGDLLRAFRRMVGQAAQPRG